VSRIQTDLGGIGADVTFLVILRWLNWRSHTSGQLSSLHGTH